MQPDDGHGMRQSLNSDELSKMAVLTDDVEDDTQAHELSASFTAPLLAKKR